MNSALDTVIAFPFTCPNCDTSITTKRLFCTSICEDEASFVRYYRSCIKDGRARQHDVQEALRIRLALILGGGYPRDARQLSPELREEIIRRDKSHCRKCGKPGTTIDHIKGSSNATTNLQLLCKSCHDTKTIRSFVTISPATHPNEWAKSEALMKRVEAKRPSRECDDAEHWATTSRAIRSARARVLREMSERQSGKKCPVCLAPLKKTPRLEYLRTKVKRLNHCTVCGARPRGACEHCAQPLWVGNVGAACASCGITTARHT